MREIELKLKCPKCSKEFTIKCTQSQFNKGRYRKFCSRTCANSRIFSQESIEKKRKSALEYIKRHNIIKQPKQHTCKYCGKIFYSNDTRDVGGKNYCSQKCKRNYYVKYIKPKHGGYREGSGLGKHGYYKSIKCDSTYELVFLIYCLDHNIPIKRCDKVFNYTIDNLNKKYFPDFEINDTIIEIKGYHTDVVDVKTNSVRDAGHNIKVLYKSDMQSCFEYVFNKYNVNEYNITTLYDNYKPKYTYVCSYCGKQFNRIKLAKTDNVFCSRKCCGKYNTMHKNNQSTCTGSSDS